MSTFIIYVPLILFLFNFSASILPVISDAFNFPVPDVSPFISFDGVLLSKRQPWIRMKISWKNLSLTNQRPKSRFRSDESSYQTESTYAFDFRTLSGSAKIVYDAGPNVGLKSKSRFLVHCLSPSLLRIKNTLASDSLNFQCHKVGLNQVVR